MASKKVQIKISAEAQEAVRVLNNTGKSLVKFGTQAQKIGQGLNSVFNPLMKALVGIGASITGATSAIAASALSIGGSFEDSMLKVKGVANASNEEFQKLIEKARQLGADLPVSAQEAADAMYAMASAGMSVGEILDGINGIVALSISQGHDLAETTGIVVSTLSAFGMDASKTGRIADIFSNAISSSQLNMEKLGYAMRYAAPVAHSLGISIEETVAAMEALANAGLKGEQIGTYLRGILTVFTDPSAEAQRALDALGVSIRDAQGNIRNFIDILQDMKAAGAGAEDFAKIFGRELSSAGAILVSASDSLEQLEQGLMKVGRTQELLNEQMGSFKNIVKAAKSAVEENLIVVFDGIQEKAKNVVSGFREIATTFAEWNKKTQATAKIIEAFFQGLGLGEVSVQKLQEALDKVDIDALAEKFRKAGQGVAAFFASLKRLAGKIPWGFIASHLDAITTVIVTGWAAGKIATIAGSVVLLGKAFGTLATSLKAVAAVNTVSGLSGLATVLPSLGGLAAALGGALTYILANPDEIDEATESIDLMKAAVEGDVEALKQLPPAMQEWIQATSAAYKDAEEKTRDTTDAVKQALEGIKEIPQEFATVVQSAAAVYEKAGDAAARVMRQFGDDVKKYLAKSGEDGAKALVDAFADAGEQTQEVVRKIVDMASNQESPTAPTKSYADSVSAAVNQAIRDFAVYAVDMVEKTQELKTKFGLSGQEAGEALKSSLNAKMQKIISDLTTKFDNPALKAAFEKAFTDLATKSGDPFVKTLKKYMDQALGDVSSVTKTIEEQLQEALTGAKAQYGGEWQVSSVISEDENSKVVQITNGVLYLGQVLEKAKMATQDISFDSLVRSITAVKPQIEGVLANIDTSKMTQDVAQALGSLTAPAQSASKAIGDNLYSGIMDGINRAVQEAKQKLASLSAPQPATAGGSVTNAMRGEL